MRRTLVLLFVLGACKKDAPPTLAIAQPASSAGEVVSCRHAHKATLLALDGDALRLRLDTARGNHVSLLGRELTVDEPEDTSFPDAVARFADAHAPDDFIKVDAKVSTPGGSTITETLELRVGRVMAKRIEGARTAGVRFAGETLTASADKVAYVRLADEARPPFLIGEARWRDIDLVAFESVTHPGLKNCGVHEARVGEWADTPVLAQGTTSHIELYDRRAGKRIDETSFTEPARCAGEPDAGGPSNETALRAWLASKLVP